MEEEIEGILQLGEKYLTDDQVSVIEECMERDTYGLSLHMGSGKTIISLIVGLKKKIESRNKEPILVVVAKSLISSWIIEINKFFGESLNYQIMNIDSRNFRLKPDTHILLVTPETVAIFYRDNNIQEHFVTKEMYHVQRSSLPIVKNIYNIPMGPYLKTAVGGSILYSKKWAFLIVDECHKYTKISSDRCQAIGAIYCKYRSLLSGTMFDEPDFERVLGYFVMLQWPNFPNNLPDATDYIRSNRFKGIKETIVEREKKEMVNIKINKHIIQHNLTKEEGIIYMSMKKTLSILREQLRTCQNRETRKKFSTYILAMITFLRQSIVSPILPIANIALTMSELGEYKSKLSVLLMKEFNSLGISAYLNDTESMKSSRIKEVMKIIDKHNKNTDKIVVFSCFCTSIDILHYYINQTSVDCYKMNNAQTIHARGNLIKKFQETEKNSILLTTYELGSEGLNLQAANVVIIVDFWWNVAKTSQAIARVLRKGQKASEIDIYFLTSNTGIEKSLFQKQQDKLILIDEIKQGSVKSTVKTLNINEIINLINANENYDSLIKLY